VQRYPCIFGINNTLGKEATVQLVPLGLETLVASLSAEAEVGGSKYFENCLCQHRYVPEHEISNLGSLSRLAPRVGNRLR
jgi:hypothetical protein